MSGATDISTRDSSEVTRRRYDRIAPVYDALEWAIEAMCFRRWRRSFWERVPTGRLLEVGIGTGKNLEHHGVGHEVVGIDLSPGMLERARRRADRLDADLDLQVADVQDLPFDDGAFEAVAASFVFCSVPDPVRGLEEARRVLAPGGELHLLEHVLAPNRVLAAFMRWLDVFPVHLWGAHIDRDTVANVQAAGFELVEVRRRFLGIVVEVCARPRGYVTLETEESQ